MLLLLLLFNNILLLINIYQYNFYYFIIIHLFVYFSILKGNFCKKVQFKKYTTNNNQVFLSKWLDLDQNNLQCEPGRWSLLMRD